MQNFVLMRVDEVYSQDSLCVYLNSVYELTVSARQRVGRSHTRLRSSRVRARIFKELEFLVASGIKYTCRFLDKQDPLSLYK